MLPIIQKIPLFADLTADQHQSIINAIVLNYYPVGHVFFNEGDAVDENSYMYIIKHGMVKISRKDDFQHEKEVAVLADNEFFGEMAFVLNEPRNAMATVIEDCEVFELKKQTFTTLMETTPGGAAKISEEFIRRLKENG